MRNFWSVFSILFFAFSFSVSSQNCEEPIVLKTAVSTHQLKDSVTWFKFKAKGSELKLLLNLESFDGYLSYQVYKGNSCQEVNNEFSIPVRIIDKGIGALTKELWDYAEKNGHCICKHCLSKVRLSQNNILQLDQEAFYYIKVNQQKGTLNFNFDWSNIDPSKKVFSLNNSLEGLEKGMVYQLKTVQFVASRTEFINKNTPLELDSLFDFLNTNTNVKINVVGHVNGPFNTDPEGYQKLSTARAEKIKEYLVEKGIGSNRITFEGKSNSMMKYPSPKFEWQAQENRRVEIVISEL